VSDHADTTPPPGPLPSVLPHDRQLDYEESARIGEALHASAVIDSYIRSKIDGDLADAANRHWEREKEERQAFCSEVCEALQELRRLARRSEANQDLLLQHFRSLTERQNALEGQHAKNHPIALSIPPSSRRGAETNEDSSVDVEAQEG
jgi:hypothetical protein